MKATSEATKLRNRKGSTVPTAAAAAGTQPSPNKALSPRLFYQDSAVPGAKKKWKMDDNDESDGSRDSNSDAGTASTSLPVVPPIDNNAATTENAMMSGEQVHKEESKAKKILVRVIFAIFMLSVYFASVSDTSILRFEG